MEFEKLLVKVGTILKQLRILYCITGGYAVSVWGRPRATFDVDVVVQLDAKDIRPLAASLRSLSRAGYIEEEVARDAAREGKEFNFFHPESGIKVDFWAVTPKDLTSRRELKRRVAKRIGKHTIYFISPEDLILSKLRWFQKTDSTRQLEDVESILRIQKALNTSYLRRGARADSTLPILESLFNTR